LKEAKNTVDKLTEEMEDRAVDYLLTKDKLEIAMRELKDSCE